MKEQQGAPLQTLQDIRDIMERSARFISLSGWSGVWAGASALAGSFIAAKWMGEMAGMTRETAAARFIALALTVLLVALAGGFFFTWRKTRLQGGSVWNSASRRMLLQITIPMATGATFALRLLYDGQELYVAPVCLAFYGLALINGSKYTLSDIKYLGFTEVLLGCIALFLPAYGLLLWGIGFGAMHILYGIVMWHKYDKHL